VQQRSIWLDQIPTEFGEHHCATKQPRILAPTPRVKANATEAAHDVRRKAQRQEQRTQRDLKVDLKVAI